MKACRRGEHSSPGMHLARELEHDATPSEDLLTGESVFGLLVRPLLKTFVEHVLTGAAHAMLKVLARRRALGQRSIIIVHPAFKLLRPTPGKFSPPRSFMLYSSPRPL